MPGHAPERHEGSGRRFLCGRVQPWQCADPGGSQLVRRRPASRPSPRRRVRGRRQPRRLDLREARLVAWRPRTLLDHRSKTRPTCTSASRFTSYRELSDHRVHPKRTDLSDDRLLEDHRNAGGRPTRVGRTGHQASLRQGLVTPVLIRLGAAWAPHPLARHPRRGAGRGGRSLRARVTEEPVAAAAIRQHAHAPLGEPVVDDDQPPLVLVRGDRASLSGVAEPSRRLDVEPSSLAGDKPPHTAGSLLPIRRPPPRHGDQDGARLRRPRRAK